MLTGLGGDARDAQLMDWLHGVYGDRLDDVAPASEDASFRRYFRVRTSAGETSILMDAPPDKEDCGPFLDVAARLTQSGVHVPAVLRADREQGFLLLEDLGDRQYLQLLDGNSVGGLYADAVGALLRFQQGAVTRGLPAYDETLLRRETALFPDWLLGRHLGLDLSPAERRILGDLDGLLVANALAQPQVFVHRDFHSRNLMVVAEGNPGIIDFQDAVRGPLSYDLVSLLRDCYVAWPAEWVDAWVEDYRERAILAGLLNPAVDAQRFLAWFDLMGVQRHLKAAGIFARLNHRDGKPGYLADIPRTLEYIVGVAARRPELGGLAALLGERVLAAL